MVCGDGNPVPAYVGRRQRLWRNQVWWDIVRLAITRFFTYFTGRHKATRLGVSRAKGAIECRGISTGKQVNTEIAS
jgi:hypothetical protein